MSNQQKIKGKAKFLGWGFVSGAYGPVVSITRCLLDGCRLVMWTDVGIWYMENNDIKDAAGVKEILIQTVSGTNQVIFKTTMVDADKRAALNEMFETDYAVPEANISAETISAVGAAEFQTLVLPALSAARMRTK